MINNNPSRILQGVIKVILNPDNRTSWIEEVQKYVAALGTHGKSIMSHKQPTPSCAKPKLNQLRRIGDVEVANKYQFGTTIINAVTGLPEVDLNGEVVLSTTDAQYDAFYKLETDYKNEMKVIDAIKSSISIMINPSISPSSTALLKSGGVSAFVEAQSDPVLMLILIEKTHKLSDDANMQAAFNNLNLCCDDGFETFPLFISEHHRLAKYVKELYLPTSDVTAEQLLDSICKVILMNNVNKNKFSFVLNSINASKQTISYEELNLNLMNFYKNSINSTTPSRSLASVDMSNLSLASVDNNDSNSSHKNEEMNRRFSKKPYQKSNHNNDSYKLPSKQQNDKNSGQSKNSVTWEEKKSKKFFKPNSSSQNHKSSTSKAALAMKIMDESDGEDSSCN